MTADTSRTPMDEDSIFSEPLRSNGIPRASHRRQPSHAMKPTRPDYENEEEPSAGSPEVQRTRPKSYQNRSASGHNQSTRSFAERAKDIPPQGKKSWKEKPLPPEPSSPMDENDDPRGDGAAFVGDDATRNSQRSTMSRSNTVRSSSDQQSNWASDRSPLQKLEVTLTGISKEEKRARVLEAEMKLKERMARQREGGSNTVAPVPPAQGAGSHKDSTSASSHQRSTQDSRQSGYQRGTSVRKSSAGQPDRGRVPSVQHTPVSSAEPPQHSGDQQQQPAPVMTRGEAPRRAVSVSHQPEGHRMRPSPNQPTPRDSQYPRTRPVSQLPSSSASGTVVSDRAQPPRMDPTTHQREVDSTQPMKRKVIPSPAVSAQAQGKSAQVKEPAQTPGIFPANENLNRDMPSNIPAASSAEAGVTSQPKAKKQTVSFNVPPPTPPPLSEWKNAPVARLGAVEFDFQSFDAEKSKAWWEGGTSNRRRSRALPKDYQNPPAQKLPGNKRFHPSLFLNCGPLLRYAGLRRVKIDGPNGPFNKETWRGSVLIVTKDSRSTYSPAPTLRVFSQPVDLLPPPPVELKGGSGHLAPEYVDPTAGLMKLGRDGRPLYVKPVEHTEEAVDLSFIENDDGIYEMSASIIDYNSNGSKQPIPANRVHPVDGESAGAYKELPGVRLYADPGRDVTFWKFNIEIELGQTQQRVAYRLNKGPALGFWVPARGHSMNIMYHSSNGLRPDIDSDRFCGPDPLWRDVLNEHQTRPFHVMIGGGDQIFNDRVTMESPHFQEWVKIKDSHDKYDAPFNLDLRAELETSFLEHYSAWFSQGLFSLVNSQIPMVNIWNDHEILEGFGSYSDDFMSTPVISGLGNVAYKYYLLFQHHSVPEETEADEPSWLLGPHPGPYINQRSRNLFMSLGDGVTFLGLDCRTERMTDEILSEQTCDLIWDRCHREIVRGETKHLIVSLAIPLAYPRVAMVKNILNSRKSLGKAGMFGGLVSKTGGKVEIFDDHWTAKHHKAERTYLIEDLQDLAAEKSVRVTILSGDVHLAAIGQFYSNPKLNVPKDRDYRYMPNIISSAIADTPETEMVSDTLNKRNRVHHLDTNTDEDMIPIFTHDVNNKQRNNKRLLPRRNWCSIREYQPGTTPPGTPDEPESPLPTEEPPPTKLGRTLSLTRGDRPKAGEGGLLRRLSLRSRQPPKEFTLGGEPNRRTMSMDGPFPPAESGESYFPHGAEPRPGPFHRRPTSLSLKSTKKTGDDGVGSFVNLEGGLAITLNLELNPRDPSGITTPYRLLVPMLRYDVGEYDPPAAPVAKGWKKWLRVRRNKADRHHVEDTEAEDGFTDEDDEGGAGAGADRDPPSDGDDVMSGAVPPETLVPWSHEGPEYDGVRESVPKRKKWFGRRG